MKAGDLIKVTASTERDLRGQTGVVLGRKKRYEPGKHPLVRVFMENRERFFDYCSLEVISECR